MTSAPSSSVVDRLVASQGDPDRTVLVEGATVLTLDREVGDFALADLLVRGDAIIDVRPGLAEQVTGADVIRVDGTGRIVLPGFQDTHRHCWQGQMRRLIPDCDNNSAYLHVMNEWLGTHYQPDDIYAGTLISALGALDAGITSMLDFFHNPRTPEHSDASIGAFADAGLRGVHTSCGTIACQHDGSWPGDLARVRDTYFSASDQRQTLRYGVIAAVFARPEIALSVERVRQARELGLPLTSDGVVGIEGSERVLALAAAGLLDEDITLIHCLDLSDEAWRAIADHGAQVSIPTTSDATIGIWESVPSIQRALDFGVRPSLSVDVEAVLSPDMFTQMKVLLNIQRMMVFNRRYLGEANHPAALTQRDVLELATIEGARTNGTLDRTGTLTPGKKADFIMITADDWNTMPLNNAFGTVVTGADSRNVEAVFVDGQVRKWAGQLVGHDVAAVRRLVEASRDRVMESAGFELDVLEQRHGFFHQV